MQPRALKTERDTGKSILTWLKPVFALAPLPENSHFRRFVRFVGVTTSGFVTVAVVLWVLAQTCPSVYRILTKWANQPAVPVVTECTFTPQIMKELESPSLKTLKKYSVKFKVDTSLGETAYGIAYTEDSRFSVHSIAFNELPRDGELPYVVFDKRSFKRSPPEVIVFFNEARGELEEMKFNGSECPVIFEMFGAGK